MKKLLFILVLFICSSMTSFGQTTSNIIDPEDIVFTKAEVEASFPGGAMAWRTYLEKNLRASVPTKRGAPVGTFPVVVKFIVDRAGNISDVQAETAYGYGMEQEVIRVIKAGPKWTPAMQNGKVVKAYRRQPVTFMVSDK